MNDYLKPMTRGELTTDEDGKKHFTYGKLRLNVTEHFVENGKTFSEILDEMVLAKARGLDKAVI